MDKDKKIIEALRLGMPIVQLSKLSGVPRITLYFKLETDIRYRITRNEYLLKINNIFTNE